ncbi:sulfite exporter TauE/SafE family protein [Legionella spiritensis]|uniref:Uncharacterized protein n=1 Tax=Legionella spiritensis TaxID=452 RepID=A0A0W0Z437_LEGSP|nr:sulfite exporter TauE/SafE family protein [Legionella spiritensis]KTD63874.1 hypothetical protein Lspi_1393 [Legionella spiritensis]SNV35603.1 Uncharacterised protein [Legionella spiritensis]
MTGYLPLGTNDSETILSHHLEGETINTVGSDARENTLGNPFSYYLDIEHHIILVTTTIHANNVQALIESLQDHSGLEDEFHDYDILCGLIGPGITEQHIVAAHFPPQDYYPAIQINLFDSKTSHVGKLFYQQVSRWGSLFGGLARALIPHYNKKATIDVVERKSLDVHYNTLGTQSLFDGVSCGYHCAANVMAAKNILENGEGITPANLLAQTSGSPVLKAAKILRHSGEEKKQNKVKSGYLDFIKKAWVDTYMPLEDDETRQRMGFQHYFLGWPHEGGFAKKVLYFAFLGFITNPLLNLIKLPTEFLFNTLSESASYLKNAIIAWKPDFVLTQYLRSGLLLMAYGLQGLFKGVSLATRIVTSPVTSAKAAWAIHPVLGIASGLLSVAAYAALIVYAAPAALSLLGTIAGPAALSALAPVLTALATPVTWLFAQVGLALAPVIGAAATLGIGTALLAGFKSGLEKLGSRFGSGSRNQPDVVRREPSSDIEGFEDIGSSYGSMGQSLGVSDRLKSERSQTPKGSNRDYVHSEILSKDHNEISSSDSEPEEDLDFTFV